jgi:endonuclease YncB( thermonuclease family)
MIGILLATASLSCYPLDGDTLVCGKEHIRLLGIDSPEMPGHCRSGRICVAGDPYYSKNTLRSLSRGRRATVHRYGTDYYDRTLGIVRFGRIDASCWQLSHRAAVYVSKWDSRHAVSSHCPAIVRRALRPGDVTDTENRKE